MQMKIGMLLYAILEICSIAIVLFMSTDFDWETFVHAILLLTNWLSFINLKQTRNNCRISFFQCFKSESEEELILWTTSLNTNFVFHIYTFQKWKKKPAQKNDLNTKKNDRNNFASILKIIVQVSLFCAWLNAFCVYVLSQRLWLIWSEKF